MKKYLFELGSKQDPVYSCGCCMDEGCNCVCGIEEEDLPESTRLFFTKLRDEENDRLKARSIPPRLSEERFDHDVP